MNIKIGSRKSPLAMKQTQIVAEELKKRFPSDTFEITGISTRGDIHTDTPLKDFGGKGVFLKEIEEALLEGRIDMAVHSAKDMPVQLCGGLEISAALSRADRNDALVYFGDDRDFKIIGTGSARREAQAKKLFPNAVFKSVRGNIHTRLEKVRSGEYDAVIMAKAALDRLSIIGARVIDLGDDFICAAGQGIIAVETVKGKMRRYAAAVNDSSVMTELSAERTFLARTGGGCHAPCGASAVYENGAVTMRTFFSDGKTDVSLKMTGDNPEDLGARMAEKTLEIIRREQE